MIIFKNPGVIDVRGITTFGVNAKDSGRHTIGTFGTGIKYAIAILLRTGHQIVIMAGTTMYHFYTKKEEMRGKAFDWIFMDTETPDGTRITERLAYTTELGKHWKMWQAYRELYCNSVIDEGGEVFESDSGPEAEENTTLVVVMGADLLEEHRKRYEFILDRKRQPRFVVPDVVEVYDGSSTSVFYQGIKVGDVPHGPSRYTYNVLERMYLSEDRRMVFDSEFMRAMGKAILASEDQQYLEDCMMQVDRKGNEREGAELHIDFSTETPKAGLFSLIKGMLENTKVRISSSLGAAYRDYENENLLSRPVLLTEPEKRDLEYELTRCRKAGFAWDGEIRVVAELGVGILSKNVQGVILLAAEVFTNEESLMVEVGKQVSAAFLKESYGCGEYTSKLLEHVLYRKSAEETAAKQPLSHEHAMLLLPGILRPYMFGEYEGAILLGEAAGEAVFKAFELIERMPEAPTEIPEAMPAATPEVPDYDVTVLEGEWSGYNERQRRVTHRAIITDPERYQTLHTIEYTDGTRLELALKVMKFSDVKEINGYQSLIEECLRQNKGYVRVADLPTTKRAERPVKVEADNLPF